MAYQYKWEWVWLCLFFLVACRKPTVLIVAPTPLTLTPTTLVTHTPPLTATPLLTATPVPLRLSVDTAVPAPFLIAVQELISHSPSLFAWSDPATADLTFTTNEGTPLAKWLYAVVTPFPTIEDELTTADLQAMWQAGQLFVDEPMATFLTHQWGEIAAPLVAADVRAALWANRVEPHPSGQSSFGLLAFDQLTPDLKVLRVNGISPLQADFVPDDYPLKITVNIRGEEDAVSTFLAHWPEMMVNRDPARLTRIAMTGVTALARATAYQMEIRGVLTPGADVAPILKTADIAHVSNEVSFSPNCPYPDPIGGTTFCSRDSYFDLLTELEVDVVELTGNHVNDYGADNLAYSLDLYEAAGVQTFGGGRNATLAQQPALFVHHDNQIAFVGCNPVGPAHAWATENQPGSRPCDDGFYTQITQLRTAGYLVIATLQYQEHYQYAATSAQQAAFQAVATAGAAAVSGSQGHHAQGFEFADGTFIHYGLGNLFFDQMDMLGTRQTFIDTYVVYDGRLLSVELWTGLIESWCCPREMTAEERREVLMAVFQASGW